MQRHRHRSTSSRSTTASPTSPQQPRIIWKKHHNNHYEEKPSNKSTTNTILTVFLPTAYFTNSLAPEYVEFQTFDTLQGLCSYLRGIVCTKGLLEAYGVGKADASASSATLTWVLKDGVGMMSGLWLAWIGAGSFGKHVKAWRLFADVVNDMALVLDLYAPMTAPGNTFLMLVCCSSVLKSFCGVAAGATRAAITQHMCMRGGEDISDVQAKEGSQETGVTLLGMILGTLLVSIESTQLSLLLFWVLTITHVWANWRAVRCLRLRTLNLERLMIVCHHAVSSSSPQLHSLSFAEVAAEESTGGLSSWFGKQHLRFEMDIVENGVKFTFPQPGDVLVRVGEHGHLAIIVESERRHHHQLLTIVHEQATAVEVLGFLVFIIRLVFHGITTPDEWMQHILHNYHDLQDAMKFITELHQHSGWDIDSSRSLLGDEREARRMF